MTTSRRILVVSEKDDAHIPFVQPHLREALTIVDVTQLTLNQTELSYSYTGKSIVRYDSKVLSGTKSIWYRKPRKLLSEDLPSVPQSHKAFSLSALEKMAEALYTIFPDALWVSDYYAIRRAGNKPAQLQLAAKLGFRVPDTVMTSSQEVARAFINKNEGAVLVKSLASHMPTVHGKVQMFWAQKIPKGNRIDLGGLHLAPAIFQQAIDVDKDIRVNVVDDNAFAATIDAHDLSDDSPIRDWRVGNHGLAGMTIEPYTLPEDIREKCIAHVKKQGLMFGVIDLVLDKKGQVWFLENNPNGQWAFVEEQTGQPIGKAIARLLEKGR